MSGAMTHLEVSVARGTLEHPLAMSARSDADDALSEALPAKEPRPRTVIRRANAGSGRVTRRMGSASPGAPDREASCPALLKPHIQRRYFPSSSAPCDEPAEIVGNAGHEGDPARAEQAKMQAAPARIEQSGLLFIPYPSLFLREASLAPDTPL
jgi:hypothetical protein